ncbi:MAG: capsule assembly Wzi family protein [Candidatus Eisenbacteria bacterium]
MSRRAAAAVVVAALLLGEAPAPATADVSRGPVEWIEVGDPLLGELELLVASGLADSAATLWSRPLARRDVAAIVARARVAHPGSRDPSLVRLERAFGRELVGLGFPAPAGWAPPLLTVRDEPDDDGSSERMQLRVQGYADATLVATRRHSAFADRSRFGGRLDVESGGLLAHLDVWAGRVDDAERFTDALVAGSEFAAHSEDSYVSFATRSFDATFGRRRQAFGPGATGTLLWSRQAAPVTSLALGATLFRHVRATAVHGDVDAARDARIAAHRLEWFPSPALTIGLHESVRYTSSQWEPLYVVPLLPFTFVQRLLDEDALDRPGDAEAARNNIMAGLDVTWRPAPGAQLTGELLLDDHNVEAAGSPTRIGYQLGGLGVRPLPALGDAARGSLRVEYTRVYNYVYATFYGGNFIHHGRPIGAPQGPDSRALHGALTVTTCAALEGRLAATWVDRGEGELGRFWNPDSGAASGSRLSGVVEKERTVEGGLRWWPRDGIDLEVALARQWIDDQAHQPGADTRRWIARATVRLRR